MSDLLAPESEQFLQEKGFQYEVSEEQGMVCLVITNYRFPTGYTPTEVELLVRLPAQFPEVGPDMFWTTPTVRYANGTMPPAADNVENHLGRQWQRWSRHFSDSKWRPGTDDLRSYLTLIRSTLERECLPHAA
jgi:hypothetical protein